MGNKKLTKISQELKSYEWISKLFDEGADIYLVGGIVRDAFLERESKDVDLVIEHLSLSTIKSILTPFGKVVENNVGETFKVLKFRPLGWEGELFDIATPRKDIKTKSGHQGFLTLPVKSIEEDLKRRDFTINSMALNLKTNKLIDLFNGLKDLKNGWIKATNKKAFAEDPLRLMRAIQFAARFEFSIFESTKKLMKANAHKITEITGERILEELNKIIDKKGNTQIALELIQEIDIDSYLLGEKISMDNLGNLDDLSFFYVLCSTADSSCPWLFYKERLKGDSELTSELKSLSLILKQSYPVNFEEILRFIVFTNLKNTPNIGRAIILPDKIDRIIRLMRNGVIPSKMSDIKINGNDIMKKLNIKGPPVGNILSMISRDALMNLVNWKDKKELLKHLEIYEK